PWPLARIVGIDAFEAWAGWDARLVARVLLAAATVGIVAILLRSPRDDRRMIPLAVILQVHAYALVGTSVHENHTLLAVILAPLLWRLWPRDRPLLATTSGFAFVSLFLAAGFGRRITRQAEIEALRRLTGMDLAVLAAVAHVVLVTALFLWAARTRRAPARTSGQAPPERPV
ncbi:MAG: hypothetical protein HY317_05205, partial [Acidobacteria bacterium]|nr:hypothetical protein [Acidobacteriota bacterium]